MNKPEELVLTNLVFPIIKELVLPKLKSIQQKLSDKLNFSDIERNFQEYLSQRYEKYSVVDTLAFPNKQTAFDILYEPLTITTKEGRKRLVEIVIRNYPEDLLPKYYRVIIEDTAGMGKSTITRKLFRSAIEQNMGIPLLIELRQINQNNSFIKEILNQLSPLGKNINEDLLLKLLSKGDFIFLLDGFDEISLKDKDFVIKDLHRFIEKANNNYFLITSRPEDSLVAFGDFQKFSVKPLTKKQAYQLIKNYDSYSYKSFAKILIKQLEKKKDQALSDFLANPFLVSLLFKSFDYKKDIPLKKTQFYRQVYDALFESHDLSKEGYLKRDKHSNLHLDDFERVLRHIGYFTSIENKVEYDKTYLLNLIEKVKKYFSDLTFRPSDYLKDLLETVPLFKKDGNNIKWAHKSFQDYFAARFIWIDSREHQELILKKIFKDKANDRFYNILDLLFELDQKTFESTILLWMLQEFKSFDESAYTKMAGVPTRLIEIRKENAFQKRCAIVITKKEEYDSIREGDLLEESIMKHYTAKVPKIMRHVSIAFNYFVKPRVVAFTYYATERTSYQIMKLIGEKYSDLVAFKSHKVDLDELKLLEEDAFYDVNDDPNNILNNSEIFAIVNDLLISGYTINYNNAMKYLSRMEKEKSGTLKDELIDW